MTSHFRIPESKKFKLSDLEQPHRTTTKVTAFSKGSNLTDIFDVSLFAGVQIILLMALFISQVMLLRSTVHAAKIICQNIFDHFYIFPVLEKCHASIICPSLDKDLTTQFHKRFLIS